jgi:hypothetical protein
VCDTKEIYKRVYDTKEIGLTTKEIYKRVCDTKEMYKRVYDTKEIGKRV